VVNKQDTVSVFVFYTRVVVYIGEAFLISEKETARRILVCDLCCTLNRTVTGILVFWDVVLYHWVSGS
jgi:hypothetical protein